MSSDPAPRNRESEPADCFLARRLGEVLPAFMKVIRQRILQTGLPEGLTLPQALTLRAIAAGGDVQPGELARHFLMSAASVTSLVDGLVQKGLVDRRHDEHDRRTVRLSLTPAGERANQRATDALVEAIREIAAGLPAERQDRLLLALDDLESITRQYREGERTHGCASRAFGSA